MQTHHLEWHQFIDLASGFARSQPGRAKIQALREESHWASDLLSANGLQRQVDSVMSLLERGSLWSCLSDLEDPSECFQILSRQGVLDLSQMVQMKGWIEAIEVWRSIPPEYLQEEGLRSVISGLPNVSQPLAGLNRVLTPQGEISESASSELLKIAREIRRIRSEIDQTIGHLIHHYEQKGLLQDSFSDLREGRYVLPVKISSQGQVDGIVYHASVSRQTVYIEPREVEKLNNQLRAKENEKSAEIYRILKEISQNLAPLTLPASDTRADPSDPGAQVGYGVIGGAVEVLSHWDSLQARAQLSRKYGGRRILVSSVQKFYLKETAHPLLWETTPAHEIVRNTLAFEAPYQALLITGPNTGGKTVLLKTLGLACICARTGFRFPASADLEIPFFKQVFVDMGDSQSLEDRVSSFEGHVRAMKSILEGSGRESLVLMDELNSATDPEEGAALCRAFIEEVLSRGSVLIATTHDPYLKTLPLSDQRIQSSGMEFDEQTDRPTYRLMLGVPGRSRALEIAEGLGMPSEILRKARSYLTKQHQNMEELLAGMERDSQELQKKLRAAEHERAEAERLKLKWHEKAKETISSEVKRANLRLKQSLVQAMDEIRIRVAQLQNARSHKVIDEARRSINELVHEAEKSIEGAVYEEAPELAQSVGIQGNDLDFQVGEEVRVPKWKKVGKIIEIREGMVRVDFGSFPVQLRLSDLEKTSPQNKKKKKASVQIQAPVEDAPQARVDLRGKRLDEAMRELEDYLDRAFRSGYGEITIIHGLGTGVLKKGTLELLEKLPYVAEFRDGGEGQGGYGATVVQFARKN